MNGWMGLTTEQISFLIILTISVVLLVSERLRGDIVAILIVIACTVTGVLNIDQALAGFSSEPAIIVAAVFVLSGAISQTGLSEVLGEQVGRLAGHHYNRVLVVVMGAVALFSAFTHHLTMTAVMLPVALSLCRERNISPSKLLMPLATAASLGTTITIIGAPAFLIASDILRRNGQPGLSIFSIAPIGLTITILGTLYMLTVGRWLLPAHAGNEEMSGRFRLDDYFTEVTVLPNSPFLNQTVGAVTADTRYQMSVVGLVRNGHTLPRPLEHRRVHSGDVLLVRTSPEEIVAIREEAGVEIHPIRKYQNKMRPAEPTDEDVAGLVQAVVAPDADFIGRTIGEIDFRRRYGAIVAGLWRRSSWLDEELSRTQLNPGDVLVLHGDSDALNRVANDRSFLMLVPFQGELRLRRRARRAAVIMLATVLVAALGLVAIEVAMLAGAVSMVLAGCMTPRQAYRAIEGRIYVFIAGAIALGTAMETSGTATLLAGWLQSLVTGWPEVGVLLALFALVALLTQVMSDAATTALFAPIATALSAGLGFEPTPFVVTVAMAAVVSFLTPIGHHGNMLIYGPGRYRFIDFVRVGAPLTLLIAITVAFLAPIVF